MSEQSSGAATEPEMKLARQVLALGKELQVALADRDEKQKLVVSLNAMVDQLAVDRDAAEKRYVTLRAENDDLQEETRLTNKSAEVRIAGFQQQLAESIGNGEELHRRGVYAGAIGMGGLCGVVLLAIGVWAFFQ